MKSTEGKQPNITEFSDLAKKLEKLVMEMDGLQCFEVYCKDNTKEELILENPANRYGEITMPAEIVLPIINKEMSKKQNEAQEIAEQIKDMLNIGGFENWNRNN